MEKLRQHVQEIVSLSDDEYDLIKPFFTPKRTLKNQFLINEGDDVQYEFLVISGIFKVFYLDEQGKEFILQFARENWWMSDYQAFFQSKKATMYIECIEAGEVLVSTLEGREKLSSELHKMEHFYRMKLTNGYIALQQRVKLLLSSTPQQRYEEFAKLYPDLLQRIPKKLIAEYLGVSRETLSRLYSK